MAPRFCLLVFTIFLIIGLSHCGKTEDKSAKSDSTAASGSGKDALEANLPADIEKPSEIVTLQLKFKKGDVFGYSIVTKQRVKVTRDSIVEISKQDISYRYKFEVLEALLDGSARLRATCLNVKFGGEYSDPSSSRTMSYDSDKKNEEAKERMFAQYNAPVRTPFEITISQEGKVESVSKLDDVLKRYMGADYLTTKFEARKKIEQDYGENALKNVIQLAFQKLENKPIGVDSSWNLKWTGNQGYLQLEHDATYILKGFQSTASGKLAHINIRMTSKYIGSKKMDTGQGMATIDKFDVKGHGHSTFNMDQGKPEGRNLTQKVYVKFFVEPPEELKRLAPDQAKDFWMVQDATVENIIERISF